MNLSTGVSWQQTPFHGKHLQLLDVLRAFVQTQAGGAEAEDAS